LRKSQPKTKWTEKRRPPVPFCPTASCRTFFFSSRRRHTRWPRDWSSDVCSSDLADLGVFGQDHVAIDDGIADSRMASDIHVVEDDGILHFAKAVDTHIVAEYGPLHAASGNDRACTHDRVQSHTHAVRIGKDGVGRVIF